MNDIPPSHGFENSTDSKKGLRGQLFLVMSDQEALRQLLSLFSRWEKDPETAFPFGLGRLKQAFFHLREIRPWDASDRIRESGLLEDWQARLQDGQERIPFEIELWFREDERRRAQTASHLAKLLTELDGSMLREYVRPEIAYHGILGQAQRAHIEELVQRPEVLKRARLVQFDGIQ